ncbi:MAG TPA: HD domain-containing protein [Methanoregula sp.]|nr:HD domain-containing protein [Methanoregula sp.]
MTTEIEITDEKIIAFLIADEKCRSVFYSGQINQNDIKNLKNIPLNESSKEVRKNFRECMLKYADYHGKRFDKVIDDLERFETQNTKSEYRDHLCHSFRVWILGRILYQDFFKHEFENIPLELPHDLDMFNFVWCLCAIYHDIGYVYQEKLGKTHGEISANLLEKEMDMKFDKGKWTKQAVFAFNAIRIHTLSKPVDMICDPYSALLILCDELQEWGRKIHKDDKRFEINKLRFYSSDIGLKREITIELFYPWRKTDPIEDLYFNAGRIEGKLTERFSWRINNIKIIVKSIVYVP